LTRLMNLLIVTPSDVERIKYYASGIYETLKDFYGRELRSLFHTFVNPFVQLHIADIVGTFIRIVSPYTTAVRMSVLRNVDKFLSATGSMEPLAYISGIVAYIISKWKLIDRYRKELEELMRQVEEGVEYPETTNMKIINREELPKVFQYPETEVLEKVACLKNTEESYRYLELVRALNMGVYDENYYNFMIETFKNVVPCEESMIIGMLNRAISALHTGLSYIIGEGIIGVLTYIDRKDLLNAYYNIIRSYQIGYEQSLFYGYLFADFLRIVKSVLDQVIGQVEYFEDLYPLLVTGGVVDFYEVFPKYLADIIHNSQLDVLWATYINGISLPRALNIYILSRENINTKYGILTLQTFNELEFSDVLPAPGMVLFSNKMNESEPYCEIIVKQTGLYYTTIG